MSQSENGTIAASLYGCVATVELDPQAVPQAERRHFSAEYKDAYSRRSPCIGRDLA